MWVHLVDNCSVGEDYLQADTVCMHRALLDEFDSAGICRQIASNLAAAFRAQIQRHHETAIFRIILQCLQNGAGFCFQGALHCVQAKNFIHLLCANYNLIVQRHAAADKPGVAALRNDG